MLKDYREYIISIRNNLIQNNVDLQEVDLESYSDIFKYSLILSQVCEFYQILLLMNSEYAIKSKYITGESYKEKVRQSCYREFLVFLEGYKKISKGYFMLNKLKNSEENEIVETSDDEVVDLFGDSEDIVEEEEKGKQTFLNIIEKTSISGRDVVNYIQSDGVSEVHGIYIDEWTPAEESSIREIDETGIDYVEHGIFIDELKVNRREKSYENAGSESVVEVHGVYIDEWKPKIKDKIENKSGYQSHGIYIDEWVEQIKEVPSGEEPLPDGYQEHGLYIDLWEESVEMEIEVYSEEYEEEYKDLDDQVDMGEDEGYDGFAEESVRDFNKERVIKKPKVERDISDSIQDVTNQLLTEGKRFLVKGIKKLQE